MDELTRLLLPPSPFLPSFSSSPPPPFSPSTSSSSSSRVSTSSSRRVSTSSSSPTSSPLSPSLTKTLSPSSSVLSSVPPHTSSFFSSPSSAFLLSPTPWPSSSSTGFVTTGVATQTTTGRGDSSPASTGGGGDGSSATTGGVGVDGSSSSIGGVGGNGSSSTITRRRVRIRRLGLGSPLVFGPIGDFYDGEGEETTAVDSIGDDEVDEGERLRWSLVGERDWRDEKQLFEESLVRDWRVEKRSRIVCSRVLLVAFNCCCPNVILIRLQPLFQTRWIRSKDPKPVGWVRYNL